MSKGEGKPIEVHFSIFGIFHNGGESISIVRKSLGMVYLIQSDGVLSIRENDLLLFSDYLRKFSLKISESKFSSRASSLDTSQ